ncbi:MAG TPA: tRNA 2-thiouridine(34) synthase MnmA [Actinomycetota bacterium]|jgi:tRNA-specific 2-thiouridylase|nr:tRNA 2-thiouridine(34) synthase MnmA [Actinomycetota bacterium]
MSRSVLVAMSGGVDSSVAACLLKEQGYDVRGAHMNLVHLDGVEHGCCGPRARADAAEVAGVAGIPFEIVDLSDEFASTVIGDFLDEHGAGRTPNPCARCNGEIKFGAFLRLAEDRGIDFVATGHYVRSAPGEDGRIRLLRGVDPAKDQSYMLHMLGQRELSRSLFPVGGMTKEETRRHAERLGLPVAGKPDSQELCFAPSGDAGAFVRTHASGLLRDGEVVDPQGRVLAAHDGTFAFTIGQRRGLGVSTGERAYVVDLDAAANRVVVGPGELLERTGLVADRVNWIAGAPPDDGPFEALVRIRYRGEGVAALVVPSEDGGVRVEFRAPQRGIAPGQSAVFYRNADLLGGGRIVDAFR